MKLYPYQVDGVRFLRRDRKRYLADGCGLGKTPQAIAGMRGLSGDTLVICPASAVPHWYNQWEIWGGTGELEVVSFGKLIRTYRLSVEFDKVIVDEAHYCKTPSAKRTRKALSLAKNAQHAYLLSGTPMPNHPGELWAPVKYLWPEVAQHFGIKNHAQWIETFCHTIPTIYGPKVVGVKNGPMLREAIRPLMLRRKEADVGLDLPPLRIDTVLIPHSPVVAQVLQEYENAADEEEAYTSTLRRLLGVAKAPLIAHQIIEELDYDAYEKIVVLYYHTEVGDILRLLLEPFGVVGYGGGASSKVREDARLKFQNVSHAGSPRVFLAQQKAAGISIDLTAAHEVVVVEPAWSPDDNWQAIKRIHRIKQERPCRARIFAVDQTLDRAIMETLVRKTRMQQEVLDG